MIAKGMFLSVPMESKICNLLFPGILQFEIILVKVRGCVYSIGGTTRPGQLGASGAREQWDLARKFCRRVSDFNRHQSVAISPDATVTLRTFLGRGGEEMRRASPSSGSISSAARFAETERVTGRRGGLMTSMDISSSLELASSSTIGSTLSVMEGAGSQNPTYQDLAGPPISTWFSR